MEEEKNVDLTNEVQKEETNAAEVEKTDNMTEQTDNKQSGKNIFSKKNNKEKAKIQELEAELEKAKADKAELNDRFLRLYSEFDNYKKVMVH